MLVFIVFIRELNILYKNFGSFIFFIRGSFMVEVIAKVLVIREIFKCSFWNIK